MPLNVIWLSMKFVLIHDTLLVWSDAAASNKRDTANTTKVNLVTITMLEPWFGQWSW